jgi:predicted  nucleic acid-binding Zn-ribbon protein
MTKTNLKAVIPQLSPARAALAAAIAEHANADRDLRTAHEAVDKARQRAWDAQDRLAAAHARPADATGDPATAFIAGMQEGRNAGVAELVAPTKTREAAETDIQQEIDALTKTRAALDESVRERESAAVRTRNDVKGAAAEVLRVETDVGALINEAEAAAADIVARRCALLQLQSLLPPSQEKKGIDSFLAHPWLAHQLNGAFVSHPAAQSVSLAHDALLRDADAELPTS